MIVPIHDCTPTPNFYLFKLLKKFLILFVGGHALDFFKTILKAYKFTSEVASLGVTSIEKIPKISASGWSLLDPSSPLQKQALWRKNVGILSLIVSIKLGFFKISTTPPLFHQKAKPHRFYQLRWPLKIIPLFYRSRNILVFRQSFQSLKSCLHPSVVADCAVFMPDKVHFLLFFSDKMVSLGLIYVIFKKLNLNS